MPEITRGEPAAVSTGPLVRRTLFDMIENPEKGWVTREVKRVVRLGDEPFWRVEIVHIEDGFSVSYEDESLYIAWFRSAEAAHMHNIGLYERPAIVPVPGVYSETQLR